jgi:hypothetical protein
VTIFLELEPSLVVLVEASDLERNLTAVATAVAASHPVVEISVV